MPSRASLAVHFSITLLCLLLLALPNVAGAHGGSHAAVETAAEPALAADGSIADTAKLEQSFARVHCPGGEGAACGCTRTWATSQSPLKPTAAGLCALLAIPKWNGARTTAAATYIPVALGALLIHLTGPRAPPDLL